MNQKQFIKNYIEGNEYEAAAFFGGHLMSGGHAVFRTYAPHASRVALIAYVKKQGCNAIEFLPLQEHPMDGSWGYHLNRLY